MGYMFNKQFRGYNTEEVDETIASLEKNIQDRSLQIRRLEEELEKMSSKELLDLLIQSTKKKLHQTPYPDDNTQ